MFVCWWRVLFSISPVCEYVCAAVHLAVRHTNLTCRKDIRLIRLLPEYSTLQQVCMQQQLPTGKRLLLLFPTTTDLHGWCITCAAGGICLSDTVFYLIIHIALPLLKAHFCLISIWSLNSFLLYLFNDTVYRSNSIHRRASNPENWRLLQRSPKRWYSSPYLMHQSLLPIRWAVRLFICLFVCFDGP